jgi:exodeoxyribonuclease-3
MVRLATWNVNSVKARLPRLLDWLAATKPDVVCLQEIKCAADRFPAAEVAELGYLSAAHGDGRWNGVALLSRVGLDDVTRGFPGEPGYAGEVAVEDAEPAGWAGQVKPVEPTLLDLPSAGQLPPAEARAVAATCDGVRIWSLYAPNGRAVGAAHYTYKLAWFAALRDALAAELASVGGPLAVCGDLNVAPTDADVWDPAVFVDATHVTPAEREALAALRDLGLHDVMPTPMKGPHPFTYWDYRGGMFHQDKGMRIDLVYLSDELAGRVRGAYVDREARKGSAPSDHAPVVVDL